MNTFKDHFSRQMKKNGHECTINYINKSKCFFREIKDMKGYKDTKYMFTDIECKQGDVVECLGKRYIVIQLDQSFNNVYNRYIVKELTHVIKVLKNLNIPCFFEDVVIKTDGTTIQYDATKMLMYTPFIKEDIVNGRFIHKGEKWIIKNQNRLFAKGLAVYSIEADARTQEESKMGFEDLEPTKPDPVTIYKVEVTVPQELKINEMFTMEWKTYNNGVIENQSNEIKWTSSNESILELVTNKYNKNTTLIPLKPGLVTVKVEYFDYTKTYDINVIGKEENTKYEIEGDLKLKTNTYTIYKINNPHPDGEFKINKKGQTFYAFEVKSDKQNEDVTLFSGDRDNVGKYFILEYWINGEKKAEKEIKVGGVI